MLLYVLFSHVTLRPVVPTPLYALFRRLGDVVTGV